MISNISEFSSSLILFSLSLLLTILTIIVVAILPLNTIIALGQSSSSSSSNATQQIWIDKLNNLKIQFGYSPELPVIDAPTELKFNVQNLQTGKQLNDLVARVVVLSNAGGQQRSFKFTNISAAPDGTFSVKYLFPDSGLYNVITKVVSNDFASLASFNLFVPFSQPSVVSNFNPLVIPVIAGIIAATVGSALILKIKKRNKEIS